MNIKKSFPGILILAMSFISLNSQASVNHKMQNSQSKEKASKLVTRKALSEITKTQVLKMFKANEELLQAFLKYNAKTVEAQAQNLKQAIASVEDKEIAKLLKFSQSKLDEIKATNNREQNNKNYHMVSMALIHIVNKYDLGSNYNAFSCPMEKKKWIQNSKKMAKIHNPYDEKMRRCGSQDTHY